MVLVFWMFSLKQTFSSSSFIFIKKPFSSSSLSALSVVSSAYLRLLIVLPAVLISAWASSSLAFWIMCSAYKLNKQGDNIQIWHTPFPICIVICLVLTVASWPAYRFLRGQENGHLFHNCPQFVVIHTVKPFSVVNEAEADVYYKDVMYVNIVNTVVMFLN